VQFLIANSSKGTMDFHVALGCDLQISLGTKRRVPTIGDNGRRFTWLEAEIDEGWWGEADGPRRK
jgi:hypothetical protein